MGHHSDLRHSRTDCRFCEKMVMLLLNCAIIGKGSGVISIIIEEWKTVALLKTAIKAEKPNDLKDIDADKLRLYLAIMKKKNDDGAWLPSDDPNVLMAMQSGAIIPDEINKLLVAEHQIDPTAGIGDLFQGAPTTKTIHVLVVVPDKHHEWRDAIGSIRQRMRLEMLLEQNLMANITTLPSSHKESSCYYSDAELGQREVARLVKDELIIDDAVSSASVVENNNNGEAFWSEEIQMQANAITNEAVFDEFIAPFFNNILHRCDGMVFVHSRKSDERYQWFVPNGFATHRGMYRASKPSVIPNNNDGRVHQQRPINGFRCGVPEEELFDCLILFQSKLTITDAAFGQMVRYLQNRYCNEASSSVSAILFDRRSFWLIQSYKSVVFKVQKAMWVNKGSKLLFQNFITDNTSPWVAYLTNACATLGVDVVEGEAFLGRGAYGRVFKVTHDGQEEVFALKIVEKYFAGRLYQEEQALANAQQLTGLTIRPLGKLVETPDSAALLLSPVGKPLPHPTTREEVRNLFELLWQLHANGLVHGDPRVPNVILITDDNEENIKPIWIDLTKVMEATSSPTTLKRLDAEILARSILCDSRTVLLDKALQQSIDNYGKSSTRENLHHLAEEVYKLLIFK